MTEITLGYDKAPESHPEIGRIITVNGDEYILVSTEWGGSFEMIWHERYEHAELWRLRQADRYRTDAA